MVVVTPLAGSRSVLTHFDRWSTPKLSGAQNQRFIQHASLFQVNNQRRKTESHWLAQRRCSSLMLEWLSHGCMSPCHVCTKRTPRSTSREPSAAGDSEDHRRRASEYARALSTHRTLHCFGLHPIRQFKRLDARFNDGFARSFLQMTSIQFLQKLKLLCLFIRSDPLVLQKINQASRIGFDVSIFVP